MFVPEMFVVMGTVKTSAEHEFANVTPPITRFDPQDPLLFPMTPLVGIVPDGVPVSAVAVVKNATVSRVVCAPLDKFHVVTIERGADILLLVKFKVDGETLTVSDAGTVAVKATVATLLCVVVACDIGNKQTARVRMNTLIFLNMHAPSYGPA